MEQKFDLWCIVELFGHQKIAGHCTEQNIAGANMLRVDVPETDSFPAFTRFFGSAAIYALNPCDEQTAKMMADRLSVKPIDTWNLSEVVKKYNQHQLLNSKQSEDDDDDDDVHELQDDPGVGSGTEEFPW